MPVTAQTRPEAGAKDTPMMAQYKALKAAHPGAMLFFRLGDFYELFFEDAQAAAPLLDIALTRRPVADGVDAPMCGVPVHSAETYLERLIRAGHKVAICEQTEDPAVAKRRSGKTLVRRDVVRVVTPGTLTEESLLDGRISNHLAALARAGKTFGLAWADVSTGTFATEAPDPADLGAALARVNPNELLCPLTLREDPALATVLADWTDRLTALPDEAFESVRGEARLKARYGVATLDGFGRFGRAELAAAGAVLGYLESTQKGAVARLDRPRRVEPDRLMRIDPATRRNLELVQGPEGGRGGSLLATIDRTLTAAGGRMLAERLTSPLAQKEPLMRRHAEVAALVDDRTLREDVRDRLAGLPDAARALSRLALGRGGPRDLWSLGTALRRARLVAGLLNRGPPALERLAGGLAPLDALADRLLDTLVDPPPVLAREGGFVRDGAVADLDDLKALRDQGRRRMMELEAKLKRDTGIGSLKIRQNNLIGAYIEVPANHLAKVPSTFLQRQSMAGATRFTTPELADLERRIAAAADQALALEQGVFEDLRGEALAEADAISRNARVLAAVDVAAALAELAAREGWTRPVLHEDVAFCIEGGRHPVVEAALEAARGRFVANDCRLEGEGRLWLVTGPNMAGKSTFLRQNALIAILAQAGSFVPAERAEIGLVDRLFSRVGAADDLARGRSTFMVEMVETATIVNQATPKSLVILDEIGRGTATYDGLSLAWAVLEHLHEVNRCRGLFATHYHELTALGAKLDGLESCHVRVKEWEGQVVFLHEVAKGAADRSYGIHVARLAGLPEAVLKRAEAVLKRLETGEARSAPAEIADDLPLFRAALATPAPAAPEPSRIEDEIGRINPDDLTPKAALDLLYALKGMMTGDKEPR